MELPCADIVESEHLKNVGIGCKTSLSLNVIMGFIESANIDGLVW